MSTLGWRMPYYNSVVWQIPHPACKIISAESISINQTPPITYSAWPVVEWTISSCPNLLDHMTFQGSYSVIGSHAMTNCYPLNKTTPFPTLQAMILLNIEHVLALYVWIIN